MFIFICTPVGRALTHACLQTGASVQCTGCARVQGVVVDAAHGGYVGCCLLGAFRASGHRDSRAPESAAWWRPRGVRRRSAEAENPELALGVGGVSSPEPRLSQALSDGEKPGFRDSN